MVSQEDKKILIELRQNSREKVSRMAFRMGKPISTVFEKVKSVEKRLIKKYIAVLDYEKLGYPIRTNLLINAGAYQEEVLNLLRNSFHTNTLLKVDNDYHFFAEMFFRNIKEVDAFCDKIHDFGLEDFKMFYVTQTLKHEEFMPE